MSRTFRALRRSVHLALVCAFVCLVALGAAPQAFAQGGPVGEPATASLGSGRIPVKLVGGKLVAACDLATDVRRIPANLFVDFDKPCSLELHNQAAGRSALQVETVNPPRTVRIIFPDGELSNEGREHGDEDFLNDFTKYHSHEIGEDAVVGTIGAQLLARYHVTIDLAAGFIEFAPPRSAGGAAPRPVSPGPDDFDVPLSIDGDLVWVPARLPGDQRGVLALTTSRHDSLIDAWMVEDLGAPAGDVEFLRVGPLDVASEIAPRPEESTLAHPDGPIGTLGVGFLENFRVEIDRVNRFARFTRSARSPFPEEDRAFFRARLFEDAEVTEAFVDQYPEARLVGEAARLLVDQRIEEFAEEELLRRAIELFVNTFVEDLRCTAALDLLKALRAEGAASGALFAGEAGLPFARADRYPESGPQIRSRLGQMLFDRGDVDGAWRHLLSAAFSQPNDGPINLYLGRVYEARGWFERAQSRYVQAVIVAESGPQAMEGLDRVSQHLGESGGLSVDTVDRLIAGKVYNFGAATTYAPEPGLEPNRRVLVEYFAGAHLDYRAALGGALAFEGITSHFDSEYVVPLTYHVPLPKLSPLCTAVAEQAAGSRGMTNNIAFVIGGTQPAGAAGRHRQAEGLFEGARSTVMGELEQYTDYELDAVCEYTQGRLVGSVTATGPADTDLDLMVVLAERGVLFPGESQVVVHRHVARANLTDRVGGVSWSEDADQLEHTFDIAVADLVAEHRAWLEAQVANGAQAVPNVGTAMDPRQLVVVAYVIDRSTGVVEQAISTRVVIAEEEL